MSEISLDKYYDAVVYDSNDDKVGGVGQVFLDESSGQPSWVTVRTGLFGLKENFVPLVDARLGDDGKLHVAFTKDIIKDAPKLDPEAPMTVAEEDALQAYYGTEDEPEKMPPDQRRAGHDPAPDQDSNQTPPQRGEDSGEPGTGTPVPEAPGHDHVPEEPETTTPLLVTDREAPHLDSEPEEGVITVIDADLSGAEHSAPPEGTDPGTVRHDTERAGAASVGHKEWSEPEKQVYAHQTDVASGAERDLLDHPGEGDPAGQADGEDAPRRAE